ncbi:M20 family metallopeptidase [Microvirga alba]|uniref:M20 family metallopeptidase n=1 Tax=Microvirga alba TaxID=2791025 RepID=A0A931FQ30_9HYPH|nr:M20 family metallopeptidase [Microvirga alba]MBF9235415.1 M20 family metallopeptidase [Microvirga alba]
MTRESAIHYAEDLVDSGTFKTGLARLIAMPTESQNPGRSEVLEEYLANGIRPMLEELGFTCTRLTHPSAEAPFLFAERIEGDQLPTILGYGHGDVVRGLDASWTPGLSPWVLTEVDEKCYGRGVVDNKGQHAINIAALKSVLETRGKLGFNAKFLIEMGEEVGSPGLRELCAQHRSLFMADALIASDGPRLARELPTLFLGTRGAATFDLTIDARSGGHHSGNWGGLLSDPAIQLAHAISTIVSPTGRILIDAWVPRDIPASVRRALSECVVDGGSDGPSIDPDWGEPGLSRAEQVFGWCSFDVLAMEAGDPATPVNAVPPRAWARCQLRFVVGINPDDIMPALRRHLDRHGFNMVAVTDVDGISHATRLDPEDEWVQFTARSIERTSQRKPVILPNLGGTLPNDIFAEVLGLRTIWVPHSYPGCSQHGPDEHLPLDILRDGLRLMTGIYWDLGEMRDAIRGDVFEEPPVFLRAEKPTVSCSHSPNY